jgi:hypothetical protein
MSPIVGQKNVMGNFPKDTKSQQLGRKGESHVKALIEKFGGIYHTVSDSADYGIDGRIEISFNENVTGIEFFVQIKSVHTNPNTQKESFSAPPVLLPTIQYWLSKITPTLILLYSNETETVWFSWVHDAIDQERFHTAIKEGKKTLSPRLRTENKLDRNSWQSSVIREAERIYHNLITSYMNSRDVSALFNCVSVTYDILTQWLVARSSTEIDDSSPGFYWNLKAPWFLPVPSKKVIPAIPMYSVQLLHWNLRAMLMISERLDLESLVNHIGKDSIVFKMTEQLIEFVGNFFLSAYEKEDEKL